MFSAKKSKFLLAAAVTAVVGLFGTSAQAVPVDLELVLAIDTSGSVSTSEFNLQKGGYVNAFNSAAVASAISGGTNGAIAVNLVYWSSSSQQSSPLGWTLVGTGGVSASDYATSINGTSRPFSGSTGVGSALSYSNGLLTADNGYEGLREVIDISGDGSNNSGIGPAGPVATAEGLGITINGLPIGGAGITAYYTDNVITSDGFVIPAANFADFGSAVQRKLEIEIGGGEIPEPATLALFGIGLAGLGFASRRRKAA